MGSVPGLHSKAGTVKESQAAFSGPKVEGRDWALPRERVLLADTVYQVSHINLEVLSMFRRHIFLELQDSKMPEFWIFAMQFQGSGDPEM